MDNRCLVYDCIIRAWLQVYAPRPPNPLGRQGHRELARRALKRAVSRLAAGHFSVLCLADAGFNRWHFARTKFAMALLSRRQRLTFFRAVPILRTETEHLRAKEWLS